MDASKKVEISVVIPVFNEEANPTVLVPKLEHSKGGRNQ
jgi:hypothetical protein